MLLGLICFTDKEFLNRHNKKFQISHYKNGQNDLEKQAIVTKTL